MPSPFPSDFDDAGLKASLFSLLEDRVGITSISYFPAENSDDYPRLVLRLALSREALIQPEEYQGLCAILLRYFKSEQLSLDQIVIRDDVKRLSLDSTNQVKGNLPNGSIKGWASDNSDDPTQSNHDQQGIYYDTQDSEYPGYAQDFEYLGDDETGQYYQASSLPNNPRSREYHNVQDVYAEMLGEVHKPPSLFECMFTSGSESGQTNQRQVKFDDINVSARHIIDAGLLSGTLTFRIAPELSVFPWDFADARSISLHSVSLSYFLTAITLTLRCLIYQSPMDLQIFHEQAVRASAVLQQTLFQVDLPMPDATTGTDPGKLRDWMQAVTGAEHLNLTLPIGYCLPLPTQMGTVYLGYRPTTQEVILSCTPTPQSRSEADPIGLCNLFLPRQSFIQAILNCCSEYLDRLRTAEPGWAEHPAYQELKAQMTALAELAK